ncbi:site-specific DNA-methyltransferase [Brevibacillus laterosporus]|uniref:DNA-methyltransferase n=2 Tax=Bacilli TaxID=91061 RepID=UPI00215C8742|nr:site-specific DNA-methyltransferase [Brevibacillus laterosporus]MCR8938776.1 site-specific DNA-methyltransferase [Brevibacillus laterosporus]MCZ0841416.1 site-specific DNA-methyltransferase [Brevibacillus laterosporus]MCZ0847692.1 site-specific DNA-methyltransferase [Brevibacillus laterosporus]
MRIIPDRSVSLIVIDPPYNIGIKGEAWDRFSKTEYIELMGAVFMECQRVLAPNGSFYWFHNDMPQVARLMSWLESNSDFVFNSFVTWDKGDWRALSWKNPSKKSNLRSWFNTAEYCLLYTLHDPDNDGEHFKVVRNYFWSEYDKSGLTIKTANELMGLSTTGANLAGELFGRNRKRFCFPTAEKYDRLQSTGYFQKPYHELRSQYEALVPVHNLSANHKNVWSYRTENTGKYHTCQKPLTVVERIIKTSSNTGDIVLDCFMGSGTTAVAALNTGRNFIGFETESKYVDIANQRIAQLREAA